jgi:4-hydroxybenzoate polyprenyltransferase
MYWITFCITAGMGIVSIGFALLIAAFTVGKWFLIPGLLFILAGLCYWAAVSKRAEKEDKRRKQFEQDLMREIWELRRELRVNKR